MSDSKNETEKIITAHGVTKKFGDFAEIVK